ncbi:hypothetical protein TSUD_336040, partial [Trifolium subterraneum]
MAAAQDHAMTPRKRVLVVDDDDRARKIHEDQLKSLGVESCSARNGKEAIDIISSDWSARTFDLILMARHMPLMDGLLTTMVLRTIGYPSLIYGVSHRLTEEEWEEFFSARPDAIYDEGKPLSIDTMKDIVESIPTPKPCYAWRERMSKLPKQGKGY